MEIQYIGEHLFPGYAGRFAMTIAFLTAFFAFFAYLQAALKNDSESLRWQRWGRIFYWTHSAMIIMASFFLFYILLNRFYEYRYVWVHVENDLSLGYQIAAFWAGQEGSFLFWTLCQVVFGLLVIRFARSWEPRVMTFFSISQFFMVSMMLGWKLGSVTIGMDPFILLRESSENIGNHFFHNPEYLSLITDGNGLNPLLRNFWMLSHPPVLFVGYAAALIPFSYALAGLWRRDYIGWIRPALPWTLAAVLFLGAGILLGGVWAYESLTFGGFWAWDPIENASLVPWLVLVAALHLMLISKKKKNTLFPTFLFTILAFVLVVYATFLTRSGVLSDTSVHSFGNDGMGRQILVYILVLLGTGLAFLIPRYRHLPEKESEEPFTREFWLFVGALILVLSAFQIIFSTSIPVINALFGTNLAPPVNVVEHYNNWQLPFAVAVGLLIGVTHYIRWGRNEMPRFLQSVGLSLVLSVVFTALVVVFYGTRGLGHILMLFASLFALFSSLDLVLRFRRQYATNGAIITHLGMALFLLAVLLTFSKKTTISQNTSGYFLGQAFPENENLLLIRDEILPMGEYYVTYKGVQKDGERLVYHVDFLRKNAGGDYYLAFTSRPSILLNERMGNVYEPFAKVYPLRDIFTYVTFADIEQVAPEDEFALIETLEIALNDTLHISNNHLVLKSIETPSASGEINPNDIRVDAVLEVITHFGKTYEAVPSYLIRDGMPGYRDALVRDLDLKFRFKRVTEKPFTIVVEVYEQRPDFIIIKTVIFPFINLLWFSCLVILTGLGIAFWNRWKKKGVD
jgi:cytochrome c-type biogenesis protein CcmF